ncbi:ATP-binding protein [Thalassospira xiamenensis]|uniref:ATPase family associated with various cellular activities (AAA) n=1 Tax=Thalassospira xiamenensis TaxID=220697 RepID=A0A285TSR5_9PROT|nr:ATP-binding protein [Thalassospira xiamenensis]SOC26650.1 ATPase family associated with various cellular activities (AAA) [Thalassospira xiamenensis]
MAENTSLMEIKRSEIESFVSSVTDALKKSRYAPAVTASASSQDVVGRRRSFSMNPVQTGVGVASDFSLVDAIHAVSADDGLPTAAETHILREIREGISIARAVVELFQKTTELGRLKALNSATRLTQEQRDAFSEYQYAAGVIMSFVSASYVAWALADYLANPAIVDEAPESSEFGFANPIAAQEAFLWELSTVVKAARSDASLAKIVRDFCVKRSKAVSLTSVGTRLVEAFVSANYRVEGSEFSINGFAPSERKVSSATLSMTFKKPEEVVGNHLAKSQCNRLAKMLMAYDFKLQTSPFVELGGHIFTFMGDGFPGTGKTTLIQMMAGLLNDYCQVAGYPFVYRNFGVHEISEYQGRSGQNCQAFITAVTDPRVIGFGTVDDIDLIAASRDDAHASNGQKEVTSVLMDAWAGPSTVVRGNCTFGAFSNYPEKVDDALRQRAGARFLIDGPQTTEDYIDLLALLAGQSGQEALGLGDAKGKLFATQNIQAAAEKSYAKHSRPQEAKITNLLDQVTGEIGELDNIHKIGVYMKRIQEVEPRFTGRAIKNIMDSVKTRCMDFEIPDEWMEKPETFMHRSMPDKISMVRELMKPMTAEMVLQEVNRYADSEVRYSDKSFDKAVENAVQDAKVRAAAVEKLGRGHA